MGVLGIHPWSRAVDFFGVSGDQMEQLGEGIVCRNFVQCSSIVLQECSGLLCSLIIYTGWENTSVDQYNKSTSMSLLAIIELYID